MGLANFQNVFIGIETTNEDSLRETKKVQNVRPYAGTLLERVHRIQNKGIDVWCGMIVGFDHDDPSIFDVLPKFLAEAKISAALIGMLHAITTTPLYDRLARSGRLNDEEASDLYGTNVIPLGMSREQLRDGFINVTQGLRKKNRVDRCRAQKRIVFAGTGAKNNRVNPIGWKKWKDPSGKISELNSLKDLEVIHRGRG